LTALFLPLFTASPSSFPTAPRIQLTHLPEP
jgi:hypothetical protein